MTWRIILPVVGMSLMLIGFMAYVIWRPIHENKKLHAMKDEDFQKPPAPKTVGATVLKKEIVEAKGGTKTPKYKMLFRVTFLTDDGKKMTFDLSRKQYDALCEGQSGMLVTVSGNFFDFGDGEES